MTSLNSFINNMFTNIMCPRCLEPLRYDRNDLPKVHCQICKFPIPLIYLQDAKKAPPIFVQLFGLTRVGKTTFLDMLRFHLYRMDKMWSGAFATPVTEQDLAHKRIIMAERARGEMPSSTVRLSRDQNQVYIMQLNDMERWNSHFLVVMDFPGEMFELLHVPTEDVPFLCRTPITIMLLSITDMTRDGKSMDDLLSSYITTLRNNGVRFDRMHRQLIVVFNKADLINNLPPEINTYLQSDQTYTFLREHQHIPYLSREDLSGYLVQMQRVSNVLMNWTYHSVPGGAGMLHSIQKHNITAYFTVMSATGHELSRDDGLEPFPRRVLDPFFWLMEANLRR